MTTTKAQKQHTIITYRKGRETLHTATLTELIQYHAYTLEVGASWQHEKGNKKININPKTINSLIQNLNNATNNAAQNGFSSTNYYKE